MILCGSMTLRENFLVEPPIPLPEDF